MKPGAIPRPLFQPGRNCWRVERAERFRCVQDGAEYFRLVREALLAARRSVFILGWDIAAGVDLLPGTEGAGAPTRLAELLDYVARRQRGLQCHVLIWDYAAFYAVERDPFSRLRFGLGTHRRVHFGFDDHHPLGASHHQKMVVVDDRLAFVGGIDLTHHRWDTTEHATDNPLRRNLFGLTYGPYHEVQAMVDGPVAASLGVLARRRWRQRGRARLPPVAPAPRPLWPAGVAADLEDVDVAIARTEPAFAGRPAVREAEACFEDQIAAARRTLYVESQYFTNARLAEAMAERLREPDGPEIAIVGPRECEGWLEQRTMGVLRSRVLERLLESDRHGRLLLLHPVASAARAVSTFVHSKVMIADDEILHIGSANLSNRSMGFDTECDVAVDAAGDARVRAGIRAVRARLLAEHVGAAPDQVDSALGEGGRLREVLRQLGRGDRRLAALEVCADEPAGVDAIVGAADPDEPMAVSQAVDRLLPHIEAADGRSRFLTWMLPVLTLAAGLLIGWRAFGLSRWMTPAGFHELLSYGAPTADALALALAAFVAGALLFVPLELLVLLTVVVFGVRHGTLLALLGVATATAAGYLVGRAIGSVRLLPWIGRHGRRVWNQLAGGGAMTIAVLRAVPVTSAAAVNLLCGAARVPAAEYAAGTLLGLAPILAALVALGALLRRAIRDPAPPIVLAAVGAALALALFARRVRISLIARRLARRAPIGGRDDLG